MTAHDVFLVTTPLAHRTGLARLMNSMCLGAKLVVLERFEAQAAVDTIERAVEGALAGALPSAPEGENVADDDTAAKIAALTPTQLKVLLGVLDGRYNKEIAYDLGISEATVRAHMTAVLRKLDVTSRTQAALAARALGLGVHH